MRGNPGFKTRSALDRSLDCADLKNLPKIDKIIFPKSKSFKMCVRCV